MQIQKQMKIFWRDTDGSVASTELILIVTLLAIGLLVGMKSLRDSALTEFADFGQALSNLNQSYSYGATSGGSISTAASEFIDAPDFCDTSTDTDAGVSGSRCVNVCAAAGPENGNLP